jgi:hypothetical protein
VLPSTVLRNWLPKVNAAVCAPVCASPDRLFSAFANGGPDIENRPYSPLESELPELKLVLSAFATLPWLLLSAKPPPSAAVRFSITSVDV